MFRRHPQDNDTRSPRARHPTRVAGTATAAARIRCSRNSISAVSRISGTSTPGTSNGLRAIVLPTTAAASTEDGGTSDSRGKPRATDRNASLTAAADYSSAAAAASPPDIFRHGIGVAYPAGQPLVRSTRTTG
jgi:hypothetical protein